MAIFAFLGAPASYGSLGVPPEAMHTGTSHYARHQARQALDYTATAPPLPAEHLPLLDETRLNLPVPAAGELPSFTWESAEPTVLHAREESPSIPDGATVISTAFVNDVPYSRIIYLEACKNGIRPELVAAIIHAESNFQPRLISTKNAQGLMQIIPATARFLGVTDPFDPEQNIAAGTRYFRHLLDRFQGNEEKALLAFNAKELPAIIVTARSMPDEIVYVETVKRYAQEYESVFEAFEKPEAVVLPAAE